GYSPTQGVRRTTIIPDDDSQVPGYADWLQGMGESVLVGTLEDYRSIGPDVMLARHRGQEPSSDRCAVVSQDGVVVALVRADPEIDKHPDGRLVIHETAQIG